MTTDQVAITDLGVNPDYPRTWAVVWCVCEESWAVDTADFTPALTSADVQVLLAPVLAAHELVCEVPL